MEQTARIDTVEILDELIARIAREAETYRAKARFDRRMHGISRIVATLLGVAAPVVVTYQTQVESEVLKMVAIFVTGFIGAATVLQASFRWGDHYGRARLTTLDLEELESKIRLQKPQILDSNEPIEMRQRTKELIQHSSEELHRIIRTQVETEVSLLTERRSREAEKAPIPTAIVKPPAAS